MSRHVVVVEYRGGDDRPWGVWGVYDSIPTLRAKVARLGMTVPTATRGVWRRWPWTWTNEWGGQYRAGKTRLVTREDTP